MPQSWNKVHLAHLMQRVILLYELNDTPEVPTDNLTTHKREQTLEKAGARQRTLSLHQEQRIAEAFALLAAKSDDPKKVVAACVEEGRNGQSMTVNLAVNNGGLEAVQKGFQRIGQILQRLNKRG